MAEWDVDGELVQMEMEMVRWWWPKRMQTKAAEAAQQQSGQEAY